MFGLSEPTYVQKWQFIIAMVALANVMLAVMDDNIHSVLGWATVLSYCWGTWMYEAKELMWKRTAWSEGVLAALKWVSGAADEPTNPYDEREKA